MAAADLVITGTVLTIDDARPTAEALAVTGGRIVAVGGRAEVAELVGPNTQTVDVISSLEVGKYADLVVLSADPRTVPPEQIAEVEVCATFLAGRQVYRR